MFSELVSVLPLVACFSLFCASLVPPNWTCGGNILTDCGSKSQTHLSVAILILTASICLGLVLIIYVLTIVFPRILTTTTKVISYLFLVTASIASLVAIGLYWSQLELVDQGFTLALISSFICLTFLHQALISELPP
ncbi:hypothetical protein Ciccas_001153 [Cichlidogyrus casuarinus]|uniref:NADH dehydrogenase subunit 6 n=1 Tax=Cichlidogyrus casuarinus TaxID=1844966 RepID=A0ABD2QKW5_9PLAT